MDSKTSKKLENHFKDYPPFVAKQLSIFFVHSLKEYLAYYMLFVLQYKKRFRS